MPWHKGHVLPSQLRTTVLSLVFHSWQFSKLREDSVFQHLSFLSKIVICHFSKKIVMIGSKFYCLYRDMYYPGKPSRSSRIEWATKDDLWTTLIIKESLFSCGRNRQWENKAHFFFIKNWEKCLREWHEQGMILLMTKQEQTFCQSSLTLLA